MNKNDLIEAIVIGGLILFLVIELLKYLAAKHEENNALSEDRTITGFNPRPDQT